ncbi:MAG TPA: hypothetical protein VGR16_09910 [Thermomicrobiales bacterium]|nr:hypothetical protein [Thermomicrobiales bacterium]
MRVVSLNMDLADLGAVTKAIDAYLERCNCRAQLAGPPCESCLSLEATRGEISRLTRTPKIRSDAPLASLAAPRHEPLPVVPLRMGGGPPPLRVVSALEAGG